MALFADPGTAYGNQVSYGPESFDNVGLVLEAPSVLRASVARGPQRATTLAFDVAEVYSTHSPIRVEVWDDTNSTLVHDESNPVFAPFDVSWTDPLEGLGDAQLTVMNSDDFEGTYQTLFPIGHYVRFYLNGAPAVVRRISNYSVTTVAQSDADKNVTVFMTDPRAIFNDVKVRTRRGIESRPYSQLRNFGWQDELDRDGWPRATKLQEVISWYFDTGDPTKPPFFTPWEPPRGWPDPYANVIWSRSGTWMPTGKSVFRRTITKSTGDGMVQMWVAALDKVTIYIDGVKVGEHGGEPPDNGWVDPYIITIYLTEGEHEIAWEVEKFTRVYPGPIGTLGDFTQRAMLAWTMYDLFDDELTILSPSNLMYHSDDDTYCLDYPAVLPAPTWGAILLRLIEEGKDRDALPAELTPSFTAVYDSEGQPWPANTEKTFRGSDGIWNVMESAQTEGVDITMSFDGLQVNAFNDGGAGSILSLEEDTAMGLSKLEVQFRGHQPNTLFVQWAGGTFEVVDLIRKAAAGRTIEDSLELADYREFSAAHAKAEAELARLGDYQNGINVELEDTLEELVAGKGAYVGFRPGDWIQMEGIPGGGNFRCKSIDVQQTDNIGNVSITPEFISAQEDEIDRMLRMLERSAPGTLNGQSNSATPIRWLDDGAYTGKVVRFPVSDFTMTELVDEIEDPVKGVSTPITFLSPMRFGLARITSLGVPTSRISIEIRKNGIPVVSAYMDPGVQHVVAFEWYLTFLRGDQLQVALTNKGDGGGYLSVALLMVPASPAEAAREPDKMPWL